MGLGCLLLLLFPHQIGQDWEETLFWLYVVPGTELGLYVLLIAAAGTATAIHSYAFTGKTGPCTFNSSHGECPNAFKPSE